MFKFLQKKLFIIVSVLSACLGNGYAFAAYPDKAIRLIIPFAPGGSSEIVARSVANNLSTRLGQSVFVENKPGAAGNIAMTEVKRAPADGYTLILGHVGTLAVNPAIFGAQLPYDPLKDFAPITLVAKVPNVVVVNKASGFKTLADLIEVAKAKPGYVNYGSAGNGSAGHLATEYFAARAGIELTHIPYKGSGPMLTDLIGGRTQLSFNGLPSLISQIKAGTLIPLAVGSAARSPALPNVPTIAEQGFPGFETSQWYGILAPSGTPKAIIEILNLAIVQSLKKQDGTQRMTEDGATLVGDSPSEFEAFIREELARWGPVVDKAKITVD